MSMTARLVAGLAVASLVLPLAACAGEDEPGLLPGGSGVDVDTPALRALKHDAGIADCEPGAVAGAVEDGLPAVTLPCLGGGPDVDLTALRGPLVVNLWAVYCDPCRDELPIYERFHQQYAGRVGVLGIDFNDTRPREALQLARDTGVTYPLLADPESLVAGPPPGLVLKGLPMIALVDADGTVVHLEAREITSLTELEQLVEEHLGVTP